MNTINPFSDPEFKKSILKGEGIDLGDTAENIETIEYEVLGEDEGDDNNSFDSIISSAPVIPHSKEIKNIILDASQIAKNEKESKALEISQNLNSILSRYNKDYNLNLQLDLSNFSRSLVSVSDPKSRRVLELYVSEVFKSMKPLIYLQLLAKLQLLIDHILDPKNLFSNGDLSTADMFVAVEKLLQYIQQISDLAGEISIQGSDLELRKIKDEEGNERDMTDEEKQAIDDFMSMFKRDSGV